MPSLPLGSRGRSLAIAMLVLSVCFAALIAAVPSASAMSPNYISGSACIGSLNPKWQNGDTWIMYGDVDVPTGCTLTIEPGATVKGDPNVHLYIDGGLVAGGTPGTLSVFLDNVTAGTPWAGIEFRAGSSGSVSWSSFQRVLIAITATSASPAINNNTILQAGAGVRLDTSNSLVADNVINGARIGSIGVLLSSSSSKVVRNSINGTNIGIEAMTTGSPVLLGNTITNVSGAIALGIYVTNLASANITSNVLRGGLGANGVLGAPGATAVGILANATPSLVVSGNSVSGFRGGRGGNGPNSATGAGGPGGAGGAAAGIGVGSASVVQIQRNTVNELIGGRGGDGGSSSLGAGGPGGRGGESIGIEVFSASASASFPGNAVTNVTAGNGGDGGAASSNAFSSGAGGLGGSAYGLFSLQGMNPDLSTNTVQSLRGGRGGNATASTGGGAGGGGGDGTGIVALVDGTLVVHANTVTKVTGGPGGAGATTGGAGGNGTAVLALGDGSPINSTSMSFNQISGIAGGQGAVGGLQSGDGGSAAGALLLHMKATLASDSIANVTGGDGGAAFILANPASKGGFAGAISFALVPSGTSTLDRVQSVAHGAHGTGRSPPASYGVGVYLIGNTTVATKSLLTNLSLSSIADFDLYVDNYTSATTLNATFSGAKLAVMSAGNLTVENFLALQVFWPNNSTFVQNAVATVKDGATTVFSGPLPSGQRDWIVVTNRQYIGSPVPSYHTTNASVTYGSSRFWDDPRFVDMNASHTESFGMIDSSAPTSQASTLPAYETAWTFAVPFTSSDQNGTGVSAVTLWYQVGQGAWTQFQTLLAPLPERFLFTTSADGVYAFATVAVDRAGNVQQPNPPTANNTWTIVDTVAPSSHMTALPLYETSLTFTVAWAPNAGVTDVATYTVQVNAGSGWTNWLADTPSTSAAYTASGQGAVQFRVLSRDRAGNVESKTANDTWTVVDTIAPQVTSAIPSGNLSVSPSLIVITFSEPMDTASVESAFSLLPNVAGSFSWSNGSRTLTFLPSQPLALGTTYTVTILGTARDLAGNEMGSPRIVTFATPAPPPAPGLSWTDLWPLFVAIAAALAALAFFLVRRRGASATDVLEEAPPPAAPATPAAKKEAAAIDDVFLLYRKDGVLIKHETRRLRPDIDTDILSGMLTAVQQFVKDSFRGEEGEELNEMTVGQMHILIGRGKWLILAATITGGDMESMTSQIQACVKDMEDHNWDRLEEWDGDMDIAKALGPYLKKLIRGEYAA